MSMTMVVISMITLWLWLFSDVSASEVLHSTRNTISSPTFYHQVTFNIYVADADLKPSRSGRQPGPPWQPRPWSETEPGTPWRGSSCPEAPPGAPGRPPGRSPCPQGAPGRQCGGQAGIQGALPPASSHGAASEQIRGGGDGPLVGWTMMIHYVMHYMIQKDQYDHSKKVWLFKNRIVMDMKLNSQSK